MDVNIDLVIQDLMNQIAVLSRDKATMYAVAQELKKELEELKGVNK